MNETASPVGLKAEGTAAVAAETVRSQADTTAAAVRPAPPLVRALSRVIRWMPIGRYRLIHESRRLAIAPFIAHLSPELGGLAFQCDPRDSVAREACYTGVYEPQETQLVSRILNRGDVFVDAGANWGYFTLTAAQRVGAAGRVLAFEPEPRLFELLCANLRLNALDWVTRHRVGLADRRGSQPFTAYVDTSQNWGQSHAAAPGARADFEIDTVRLDDALDAAQIARAQLTKIDIEGGEAAALVGMERGLSAGRYRYLIVECHPALLLAQGRGEAETLRPLVNAGYRLWTIRHNPHLHRLAARRQLATNELLRPYVSGTFETEWPHLLAAAPDAPDLP
jgi:FkbM family methyltransferase